MKDLIYTPNAGSNVHNKHLAGISIIKLLVALLLLAMVSVAGLKIMQTSKSSFTEGQQALTNQQKSQAIAAFIKEDFNNNQLAETELPVTYTNTAMPADLKENVSLKLATVFGNGSRFSMSAAKCVLLAPADPANRLFTFAADCQIVGQQTIAAAMNKILSAGARIGFAIDGAGAKCTASIPIENTAPGMIRGCGLPPAIIIIHVRGPG